MTTVEFEGKVHIILTEDERNKMCAITELMRQNGMPG